MLAIISAVREDCLKRYFSAEREIWKLMFAFDHIKYAGYIAYPHVYLNNLLRKNNSIVKDLITNGHGASCSEDSSSTIHGDLVTKHFKKKRKELLDLSPQVTILTFIYAVNKWIKTSHIQSKVRTMLQKKLNVLTSQVHREMTPGNKRLHFEHARCLKANLKQYNVNIFGDGSAENLTTSRNIDNEVIDGLLL